MEFVVATVPHVFTDVPSMFNEVGAPRHTNHHHFIMLILFLLFSLFRYPKTHSDLGGIHHINIFFHKKGIPLNLAHSFLMRSVILSYGESHSAPKAFATMAQMYDIFENVSPFQSPALLVAAGLSSTSNSSW